jgi:hypothetical protein
VIRLRNERFWDIASNCGNRHFPGRAFIGPPALFTHHHNTCKRDRPRYWTGAKRHSPGPIREGSGPGLCRILDMNFGESIPLRRWVIRGLPSLRRGGRRSSTDHDDCADVQKDLVRLLYLTRRTGTKSMCISSRSPVLMHCCAILAAPTATSLSPAGAFIPPTSSAREQAR